MILKIGFTIIALSVVISSFSMFAAGVFVMLTVLIAVFSNKLVKEFNGDS